MAIRTIRYSSIKNPKKFQSLAQATYVIPTVSKPGMVLINPTSIEYSGTSATKGTNGKVTFNAVTSLSLNGVFSADFDNYVVSMRLTSGSNGARVNTRLRVSGSDVSGSNYTQQILEANGSFVGASRATTTYWETCINYTAVAQNGSLTTYYGPFLTQPSAFRTVSSYTFDNAYINESAGTHSLSTSYDSVTFYPSTGSLTGALQVYGVRS